MFIDTCNMNESQINWIFNMELWDFIVKWIKTHLHMMDLIQLLKIRIFLVHIYILCLGIFLS